MGLSITINLQCFMRKQRPDLRQGAQPTPSAHDRERERMVKIFSGFFKFDELY